MENEVKNVQPTDLSDIVVSENIQEPNSNDMKIKEGKIDKIKRKGTKTKNKFASEDLR